MEQPFKETITYYNNIRQVADTNLINEQIRKLEEQLAAKQKELNAADTRETHKAILSEIADLDFDLKNKERILKEALNKRPIFFLPEEREQMTKLYNKEITPLIQQYDSLTKKLDAAVQQFEKEAAKIAGEMLKIEKTTTQMTEVRMKLLGAEQLRTRSYNYTADHYSSGNRPGYGTYPGAVLGKLNEIKRFAK